VQIYDSCAFKRPGICLRNWKFCHQKIQPKPFCLKKLAKIPVFGNGPYFD